MSRLTTTGRRLLRTPVVDSGLVAFRAALHSRDARYLLEVGGRLGLERRSKWLGHLLGPMWGRPLRGQP